MAAIREGIESGEAPSPRTGGILTLTEPDVRQSASETRSTIAVRPARIRARPWRIVRSIGRVSTFASGSQPSGDTQLSRVGDRSGTGPPSPRGKTSENSPPYTERPTERQNSTKNLCLGQIARIHSRKYDALLDIQTSLSIV
jgi:hypothetical protein